MDRLKGKVAIVTGSGAGIGKCIAEVFAAEGAAVAACSRRLVNGQPVVDGIVSRGGKAIFVEADVSEEEDVERLVQQVVSTYGRVDVLVNNAGVFVTKPFVEMSTGEWDRVINTDLRGTFLCTLYSVREMVKTGGGSIINIASNHAVACFPESAAYDAAKWGVIGLTKSVAVELGDKNVRANVLSPGLIDTPMWQSFLATAPDPEECLAFWMSNIPMGRAGLPEEIAMSAVFLASDESTYVTGTHLVVDGGVTSQLVGKPAYKHKSLDARAGGQML